MKEIFRFFHKCFFALQKFKSFFILSIFFDALLQGIKLIEPWILASMLDSLYKNSKDVFLQKVATLSLIIIMQITLSYIFIRLKSYVTRGVNAACKKNIYSKIADVPPTLLSDYSTGNLINVTLDDSAHIVDYCYTLCSYLLDVISVIIIGGILLFTDKISFVCAFCAYPLIYFINKRYSISLKKKNKFFFKTTDNVTEELKLFLSASSDIWINALSKFTKKQFNNTVDANMSAGIDCDKAGLKLSSISSTINMIGNMAFFLMGGLLVFSRSMEASFFVAYASYVKKVASSIFSVSTMTGTLQKQIVRISRFFEIENICEKSLKINSSETGAIATPKTLSCQNLGFKVNEKEILRNTSVSCAMGEVTALVGANGSGKTTLLNIFSGIYLATEGRVLYGTTNISEVLNIPEFTSYAFQVPVIYHATVLENIILEQNCDQSTLERVVEICKRFLLHDDIVEMPHGYNTYLTAGYKLSAGQQKKMQLIRCILRNTPILLLDEPFANLDKKSKRNIMSFFKEYSQKHIVIIATHDQDTIDMFDQVINIQDSNTITLRDNYL